MGIWARIEGKVSVKQTSHVSLKKIIGEVFESIEHSSGVANGQFQVGGTWFYDYDVNVIFDADGEHATKLMSTFLSKLKEADKDLRYDLELEARFMG